MADMYCQNKECCYKKNSNQIRKFEKQSFF